MDSKAYFLVDGSCLFSAIKEVQRQDNSYRGKKLAIDKLARAMQIVWASYTGATIRVIFYFKKNDSRLKSELIIPNPTIPGSKSHWQIKECGENIKSVPEDVLEKLPKKYRDVFPRAEKGLDIKLVCDALQLVATNKADNIVLFVNDSDYIPFFETLQNLGVNVYLTNLYSKKAVNKKLAELADMYLTLDSDLPTLFL